MSKTVCIFDLSNKQKHLIMAKQPNLTEHALRCMAGAVNYRLEFVIIFGDVLNRDILVKIAVVRALSLTAARALVYTFYTDQGHKVRFDSTNEVLMGDEYPYDFTY